jgi:hypothetical protein
MTDESSGSSPQNEKAALAGGDLKASQSRAYITGKKDKRKGRVAGRLGNCGVEL